jgi:hypothetical protein
MKHNILRFIEFILYGFASILPILIVYYVWGDDFFSKNNILIFTYDAFNNVSINSPKNDKNLVDAISLILATLTFVLTIAIPLAFKYFIKINSYKDELQKLININSINSLLDKSSNEITFEIIKQSKTTYLESLKISQDIIWSLKLLSNNNLETAQNAHLYVYRIFLKYRDLMKDKDQEKYFIEKFPNTSKYLFHIRKKSNLKKEIYNFDKDLIERYS